VQNVERVHVEQKEENDWGKHAQEYGSREYERKDRVKRGANV